MAQLIPILQVYHTSGTSQIAYVAYLVLLLSGTLNRFYNSSFGLAFVYYKILAKYVRL